MEKGLVIVEYRIYGRNDNIGRSCYMNKNRPISWCSLFDKIGKQPIHKMQHTKVQVLINGELKECALVFTDNGSNFHLEIIE